MTTPSGRAKGRPQFGKTFYKTPYRSAFPNRQSVTQNKDVFELKRHKRPQQESTFQSLINVVAKHYGLDHTLQSIHICREFTNLAAQFWTIDPLQPTVFPLHLKNSLLTVGVTSSVLAHQVNAQKTELLQLLQAKFGQSAIQEIKVIFSAKHLSTPNS